jgi:hypothetical protein
MNINTKKWNDLCLTRSHLTLILSEISTTKIAKILKIFFICFCWKIKIKKQTNANVFK